MKTPFLVTLLLLSAGSAAIADDVTRDITQDSDSSSAYAAVGAVFSAKRIPLIGFDHDDIENPDETKFGLTLSLEGRFQYKRFFAELIEDSFSNATIGYSVYNNDTGSLELITTNYFYSVERSHIEGFQSIEDRRGDLNVGVRSSHFFNNNLLQFEVVGDVGGAHNGLAAAVHFGHRKQFLNWNLYGLAGVRYFTNDVIDHLFGVNASEATEILPEYKAADGFMPSIQLGATLPLSENWTFTTKAEYAKFPDSIAESPLAQGQDMVIGQIGLTYIMLD